MLDKSHQTAQQNLKLSYLPKGRKHFGNLECVEMIRLGTKEKAGAIKDGCVFRFYVYKKEWKKFTRVKL